jgi:hypothetical protein
MRDITFVAITVGFFALAAGYVRACGWLIGSDGARATEPAEAEPIETRTPGS